MEIFPYKARTLLDAVMNWVVIMSSFTMELINRVLAKRRDKSQIYRSLLNFSHNFTFPLHDPCFFNIFRTEGRVAEAVRIARLFYSSAQLDGTKKCNTNLEFSTEKLADSFTDNSGIIFASLPTNKNV